MVTRRIALALVLLWHCSTLQAEPLSDDKKIEPQAYERQDNRYRQSDWNSISQDINKQEEPPAGIFAFLTSLPQLAVGVNNKWFDASGSSVFSKILSATPVETVRILATRINESSFKWDFTTDVGSFDVKSPIITAPWTLESLAGSDTSGRYRLGFKVSRSMGDVTTSLAWRYSGSGLWGTDTGQWNELLLDLALSQWKFDMQWRMEETAQRLRFALAWNDPRWKASVWHKTNYGRNITSQYGLAWARHLTIWRFTTTLGLQWATGTDGQDNLSPWLQLALPLGDLRLEWKMKYDDILSGRSSDAHQTITLSIQHQLP